MLKHKGLRSILLTLQSVKQFCCSSIIYKYNRENYKKYFSYDKILSVLIQQNKAKSYLRFLNKQTQSRYNFYIYYQSFLQLFEASLEMDKTSSKNHLHKDVKAKVTNSNSSKNKKQTKQSSSKNLKLKTSASKGYIGPQEGRLKQQLSPSYTRTPVQNDYGVNTFYAKYKVKTSKKKQSQQQGQSTDYGNFNASRDAEHIYYQSRPEKNFSQKEQSEYASNAFQKLKLPNQRGLINAEGKFVNQKKEVTQKNYSFREQSTSKHSFSLNYTNKQEGSKRKLNKSKHKNKISNKSLDQKMKYKSKEKSIHQHHSYYQKRKSYSKKKKRNIELKQITKISQTNSKALTQPTQAQSRLIQINYLVNDDFMKEVKQQISKELQMSKGTIRKQRVSEGQQRQRFRSIHLLSKICNALGMKRQSFYLTIYYMDQYINQYSATSMKLVILGALTLALKMDDAEMTSKFCFQYLYNPQKTVKRNSSGLQLKLKQKHKEIKQAIDQPRQLKSKLSSALSFKVSQEKKPSKQDFTLDQILEFETQIMVKLNFKLVTKSINYWMQMFTTLWDSFLNYYKPPHYQILQFRSQLQNKNWSYLLQLIQTQFFSMQVYNYSKICLVLGGLYLVSRMALQQKKQETPWEELCRYYRASLAKSTNLIFCDGVGINPLFGDYLNIFDLSISNIVDCIQVLSRNLQPSHIKTYDYSKAEGKNREDKFSTYQYNEELYLLSQR